MLDHPTRRLKLNKILRNDINKLEYSKDLIIIYSGICINI